MTYHEISLNITDDMLRKIAHGDTVHMKPHHMNKGKHRLHLTKQQINRMSNAKLNKKGMRLKLSNKQHAYNRSKYKGSGFFGNVLGLAKKAAQSDTGKALINSGAKALSGLATKGIDALANKVQQKTGFDTSGIAQAAKNITDKTLQHASNYITGSGTVANILGSIPILGSFLGPIAAGFGGKISKKHAHAIAKMAISDHVQKGGSVRKHLQSHIRRHLAGGSFIM